MIDSQLVLRDSGDGDLTANEQAEAFVDFGLGGMLNGLTFEVIVPAAGGTSPTVDIKIQASSDGTNPVGEEHVLPQISAKGTYYITFNSRYQYFRWYATVGGTSPDFGEVLIHPVLAGRDSKR